MLTALTLTTIAGLATTFGALIALRERAREPRALGSALAFAAGAMLTVSALELLPHSFEELGVGAALAFAAGGLVIVGVLDFGSRLWERRAAIAATTVGQPSDPASTRQLLRTGLMTALALTAHNIPEGFATFSSALQDTAFALPLAAAIALHNVPEGVAIAAPILHATGSRTKAILATTLSGLSEPIGALTLYGLLALTGHTANLEWATPLIAGVMIAISTVELLPLAFAHARLTRTLAWCAIGCLVMAGSLWALGG